MATRKTAGKPARKSAVATPAAPAAARKAPVKRPAAKKAAAPAKRRTAAQAPAKAAPVAKKSKPAPQAVHKPKQKLVRDSFTMPQLDFDLIAALKKRALAAGQAAKKSELLRAGLHALTRLDDANLRATLNGLVQLKAGRPRKDR